MKVDLLHTHATDLKDDYTIYHLGPAVLGILILLDIVLLFYILFSSDERFKKYRNLLIIIHGSIPITGKVFSTLNLWSILLILTVAILICSYTVLVDNELFVKIISTVNTIAMSGIIIQTVVGISVIAKIFKLIIFWIISFLLIVLALKRFDNLFQIQKLLVCYFTIAYLVDTMTNFKVLSSGEKDTNTIIASFVFDVIVICCMVYVIFN